MKINIGSLLTDSEMRKFLLENGYQYPDVYVVCEKIIDGVRLTYPDGRTTELRGKVTLLYERLSE